MNPLTGGRLIALTHDAVRMSDHLTDFLAAHSGALAREQIDAMDAADKALTHLAHTLDTSRTTSHQEAAQ